MKQSKRSFAEVLGAFLLSPLLALADNSGSTADPISYGGFIDSYLAHDFNDPFSVERAYTTQAARDDEPRINIGMVDAKLSTEDYRGRLALQAGDSVKLNYSSEKDLFWRYIQESSFGAKIGENTWVDAGIYPSHIGFETFNSRDNWNYTRSLVADYSPYYETGAKITSQMTDTVSLQFNVIHGWQNISTSSEPGYGMQVSYTPASDTQFVYANYLGHQNGGFRDFHDFIVRRDLNDALSVALQVDVGTQGRENESTAFWHGFTLLSKYKFSPAVSLGARVERYSDPHQVILSSIHEKSFDATGLSANIDYEITKGLVWRTEYRVLLADNAVFPGDNESEFRSQDQLLVTSLAYSFDWKNVFDTGEKPNV